MSYGNWSFFINGPAVHDSVPADLWSLNIPLDIFKEKLKVPFHQNCPLGAHLWPWRIFAQYKLPYIIMPRP